MIRARVVFPEPGGPQKMRDGKGRAASTDERNFPSPRISSCPTNPARVVGRILSASGARGAGPPARPGGPPGKRGYEDPEDGILFLFSFRYIILSHHEVRRDHRQAYGSPGREDRHRPLRVA